MPRPIQARIDLSALRHNCARVRSQTPSARVWAVLKADAYGHGLLRVARSLAANVEGFAVLELSAAITLRNAGLKHPIMLLEGCFEPADLQLCAEYGLTPAVHHLEQLRMFASVRLPAPLPVYLKINTGMNRLGFTAPELPALQAMIEASEGVGKVGVMTHFANADDDLGVQWQLERFTEMRQGWLGRLPGEVSMANSAAILRYPQTAHDWVRPGIVLYGASPLADASAESFGLKPVMTLSSKILGVQDVPVGDRVGYGGTYEVKRPTRIGIVACGYADGYPRHAPSGTPILVAGKRTTTVGRVSMDMLACDLTDIPDAGVDSPVVLWGEGMPADEVATAAGTISYEMFCALARRVPIVEV